MTDFIFWVKLLLVLLFFISEMTLSGSLLVSPSTHMALTHTEARQSLCLGWLRLATLI